jgi:phosphoglycerate dehydrogenase-like enzyme
VLGTPHLGYVTEANYRAYFTGVVEDIAAWQAGHPIRRLG